MQRKEDKLTNIVNGSLWDLPSPSSMSYFWNFGSTLGLCLAIQIITGLLLTFHYTSYSPESFSSVVEIMREIWSGWVIRFIHMNGASVFFFFIYLHLFRGLFFLSSVHKSVWMSGVTILIALMAISFLGYVLPWGQMSYWAVAVITNLFSVVPLIGNSLVSWIWGGFSVSSPTLTRFYSLHFLLPFVLSFLVIIHLFMLHKEGSSNSMGLNSNVDKIQFHPYFSVKDLFYILAVIALSLAVSFYYPYILGDPVNSMPANPMQTPIHIQPEWYFLPSYAILRSLPSKTAGVLALALSVTIFYILPMYKFNFSTKFTGARYLIFWATIAAFAYLMILGALPAEEPYVLLSKIGSMTYFSLILALNI
uniref:Cytochrome b n=1 Tax=Phyllocoptes taishanensis TaxID=1638174 RepID=A0A0U2J713_9ACAR|nr:cytochrome b [Phyllocoptes taishanensis]ALK03806.1 cytochrome b [Phyllocoptes taishanensis]